ncbi:TRAP transporter substrate-binding protein [Psychrobacillus sp. OK032]|uniref:TRAP transporter substrate-binding protein n=1 Tax=Psychrobacillus sp. OK032 TaxID=1884358 RepID=UPI0015A4F774|nr:TRAP transporter substrate-binding protein DctP [Psychrobacillus sp. OK032]
MKKFFIGIFFPIMFIISACSGASETSQNSQQKNNDAGNSNNTKYVLKVSHTYPTTGLHHQSMEWFNDELVERSNGRLSLEIYPSAQIMPPGQEIQAMLNGQIDMNMTNSALIGSIDPIWYLFELPYLFEFDMEDPSLFYKHKRAFFDSEKGGEVIKKKTDERGLKVLSMTQDNFSEIFTAGKGELVTDLKSATGLKLRTPGGTVLKDSINAIGANAVVVDAAEVATSIQQGALDGVISTAYYALSNYPIKTWTSVPINNFTIAVMMSNKKFDSLPTDLQSILVETSKDFDKFLDEVFLANLKNNEKLAKEKGVEVYFPTEEEHNEFKKVLLPLHDEWAKTVEGGQQLLDEIENTRP